MIAIEAANLGKRYRRYDEHRPSTLQEAIFSGFKGLRRTRHNWALRNVSFTVTRGQALGIVGRNGSGKSTLLRLAGGVMRPDEGHVTHHGRLGGLLELTAGFHPDLTGRENAIIGGVLRKMTRAEVVRKFESIVEFAELSDSIDRPLRTYSSGMQMRLAFSVAVHAEPDILLVDEVLAVGDAAFQNKCLARIRSMLGNGCSIVMVSHDAGLIQQLCHEALWLSKGTIAAQGAAATVVTEYMGSLQNATLARTDQDVPPMVTSQGVVLRMGQNRFGDLKVEVTDVRLCSTSDPSGLELADGDALSVEIDYVIHADLKSPIFSVSLIHDDGRSCLAANTEGANLTVPSESRSGHLTVRWPQLKVEPGTYFVEIGAYEQQWSYAYDYHRRCYPLIVRSRELIMSGTSSLIDDAPRAEWFFNHR